MQAAQLNLLFFPGSTWVFRAACTCQKKKERQKCEGCGCKVWTTSRRHILAYSWDFVREFITPQNHWQTTRNTPWPAYHIEIRSPENYSLVGSRNKLGTMGKERGKWWIDRALTQTSQVKEAGDQENGKQNPVRNYGLAWNGRSV
jgi:hypothetical protein